MTRRLRASACLLALLYVGAGRALAQNRPWTTAQLVQQALDHNRDLQASRERAAQAQGLLRQAGVRLAPTVDVDAETGQPLGTEGEDAYSVQYVQPIETAGKRGKRVSVAQQGVALAEANLAEETRQLVFEVKTRVAEVRAAQRKTDAIQRLLVASQQSYTLTQARVAQGDAAVLDQRLQATALALAQAEQATFRGRRERAVLDLGRAIGIALPETLTLAEDPSLVDEPSLEALKQRALRGRPDLLIARAEEAQATAAVSLARAEGVPDVAASATYSRRNTAVEHVYGLSAAGALVPIRDRDNILSVGLSIPLFTSGRNRGNIDAATASLSAASLHRQYLESTIPQEVEAAYRRWTAAKDAISAFQHGVVDQSERNLNTIRQAYTLGQLRLLDVLNEQRTFIETELTYIDAQTELAEAAADLERAVGSDLL